MNVLLFLMVSLLCFLHIYSIVRKLKFLFLLQWNKQSLKSDDRRPAVTNDFSLGLQKLKDGEGLCRFMAGRIPIEFGLDAEIIKELLRHSTGVAKLWEFPPTRWRERRPSKVAALFYERISRHFLMTFNECGESLMKALTPLANKRATPFFFLPLLKRCSMDIAYATGMGFDIGITKDDLRKFYDSIESVFQLAWSRIRNPFCYSDFIYNNLPDGLLVQKHLKIIQDFTLRAIRRKKAQIKKRIAQFQNQQQSAATSFLDFIMESSSLKDEEIAKQLQSFLIPAMNETFLFLFWSLNYLGNHLDQQEKIRKEIDLIDVKINGKWTVDDLNQLEHLDFLCKESLNKFSPGYLSGRLLTQDINIKNFKLTEGTNFLLFHSDSIEKETSGTKSNYSSELGHMFAVANFKLLMSKMLKFFHVMTECGIEDMKQCFFKFQCAGSANTILKLRNKTA